MFSLERRATGRALPEIRQPRWRRARPIIMQEFSAEGFAESNYAARWRILETRHTEQLRPDPVGSTREATEEVLARAGRGSAFVLGSDPVDTLGRHGDLAPLHPGGPRGVRRPIEYRAPGLSKLASGGELEPTLDASQCVPARRRYGRGAWNIHFGC